jgi:hypothetical protein
MSVAKFVGITMLAVPSALVVAAMFASTYETPDGREVILAIARFLLVAAYVTFAVWLITKGAP